MIDLLLMTQPLPINVSKYVRELLGPSRKGEAFLVLSVSCSESQSQSASESSAQPIFSTCTDDSSLLIHVTHLQN